MDIWFAKHQRQPPRSSTDDYDPKLLAPGVLHSSAKQNAGPGSDTARTQHLHKQRTMGPLTPQFLIWARGKPTSSSPGSLQQSTVYTAKGSSTAGHSCHHPAGTLHGSHHPHTGRSPEPSTTRPLLSRRSAPAAWAPLAVPSKHRVPVGRLANSQEKHWPLA